MDPVHEALFGTVPHHESLRCSYNKSPEWKDTFGPRSTPPSSPVVRKQHSSVPRSEGQPYKTADPSEPQMPIREPLHRADDLKRHNKLQMKWQESMRKRLELGASAGDMDDIKDAL